MITALTRPVENFVNKIGSFAYCGFGAKNSKSFERFMKACDFIATTFKLGHKSIEEVNNTTYRSSVGAITINTLISKEIKNIIDLRMTSAKKEAIKAYEEAGISYYHIPLNPLDVDLDNLKQALEVAMKGEKVLIHCARGIDRTGLLVGLVRVFQDSWDKTTAYDEMISYGFIPNNFPMMNKAFDILTNNLSDEMA